MSHFFIEDDGSNVEIYVKNGFIHLKETSYEDGARKTEEIKGNTLNIAYVIVDGQAQEASLEMETVESFPSQRCEYHIPAMWPACMLAPGQEHRQLPALQAFFQRLVAHGALEETILRSRNTLAREQIITHSYTACSCEKDLFS